LTSVLNYAAWTGEVLHDAILVEGGWKARPTSPPTDEMVAKTKERWSQEAARLSQSDDEFSPTFDFVYLRDATVVYSANNLVKFPYLEISAAHVGAVTFGALPPGM
jgi:hypothetical protein